MSSSRPVIAATLTALFATASLVLLSTAPTTDRHPAPIPNPAPTVRR